MSPLRFGSAHFSRLAHDRIAILHPDSGVLLVAPHLYLSKPPRSVKDTYDD